MGRKISAQQDSNDISPQPQNQDADSMERNDGDKKASQARNIFVDAFSQGCSRHSFAALHTDAGSSLAGSGCERLSSVMSCRLFGCIIIAYSYRKFSLKLALPPSAEVCQFESHL